MQFIDIDITHGIAFELAISRLIWIDMPRLSQLRKRVGLSGYALLANSLIVLLESADVFQFTLVARMVVSATDS